MGRVRVGKQCPNPTRGTRRVGSGRVRSHKWLPEPEPDYGVIGFGSGSGRVRVDPAQRTSICRLGQHCSKFGASPPTKCCANPPKRVTVGLAGRPDNETGCPNPNPIRARVGSGFLGSEAARTRPPTRRVSGLSRVDPTHLHPDSKA